MLLLFFKKDGAYLFIITKALESKPIYFKPPPYCNPTHAPTPLGSKPIRFRFQILWVRMQSISFPKPAGIEANRLIPLGPNAIQFILQTRWNTTTTTTTTTPTQPPRAKPNQFQGDPDQTIKPDPPKRHIFEKRKSQPTSTGPRS